MQYPTEPQIVCELRDSRVGLTSYVVIDSVGPGGACGGVRISADLTLREIKALARTMTLKYRFLGVIPLGGAKAGIVMPPDFKPERRQEILEAFGRQAAPLLRNRIYLPWSDMNTGHGDLNQILAAAGLKSIKWFDSGYYTALTVIAALQALCETRGIMLQGLSAAVEGFGSVGGHVARELQQIGVRVVAVSTSEGTLYEPEGLDIPALLRLRAIQGVRVVHHAAGSRLSRESLLELPVDLLVPAAAAWTIHAKNAYKIKSWIIVPAANIPVTDDAKAILSASGTTMLPDFVCNSGGALGSFLENSGMEPIRIRQILLEDFKFAVRRLITHGEIDCPPQNAFQDLTGLRIGQLGSLPVRAVRTATRLLKQSISTSRLRWSTGVD